MSRESEALDRYITGNYGEDQFRRMRLYPAGKGEKCFACDRKLGRNPHPAVTEDLGQIVYVGSECYKNISYDGWQPPKGGPRLYRGIFSSKGELIEVVGIEE